MSEGSLKCTSRTFPWGMFQENSWLWLGEALAWFMELELPYMEIQEIQGMLGWVDDPASPFPDRTDEGEELGKWQRNWERLLGTALPGIPEFLPSGHSKPCRGVRNNPRMALAKAPGCGGVPAFSCEPGGIWGWNLGIHRESRARRALAAPWLLLFPKFPSWNS